MNTALDTFLPMVRGRLGGCPESIMLDGIRDACIEFCRRTKLLVEDVDLDVVAGERTVELIPDEGTAWDVLKVWRSSGEVLTASNRQDVADMGYDIQIGTPRWYYLEGDGLLVLGAYPDTNETLKARVTLAPKSTATRVPEVLWTDYREPICAGARAWVRRHYGAWAERQAENDDREMFDSGVSQASYSRAQGGARTPLHTRAHSF